MGIYSGFWVASRAGNSSESLRLWKQRFLLDATAKQSIDCYTMARPEVFRLQLIWKWLHSPATLIAEYS
jgi:hypothetical protein